MDPREGARSVLNELRRQKTLLARDAGGSPDAAESASSWILAVLFLRVLEARGIGASHASLDARALERLAPRLGARELLLARFHELRAFPATRALLGRENPLWRLAPSEERARELAAIELPPGKPHDTRFLGDLYEELDPHARKRFALAQTPRFIEEFILDRTLSPALDELGPDASVLDPACGSGHFLLGAFERLLAARRERSREKRVARALALVHGIDVNPFAAAIARFRLLVAALEAGGDLRDLEPRVAVADSLLETPFKKKCDVVVGNPPYITARDPEVAAAIRKKFGSVCHRQFHLDVPFVARFFELAARGGRVGMITSNAFMKREFGKKLVADFLPTVDLERVYDTSGAFVPGHGTPTVILVGRNRPPRRRKVLVAMGKRGEPVKPADPALGKVWRAIATHGDQVGHEDDFVSVVEVDRDALRRHPWTLRGGSATEVQRLIEARATRVLGDVATAIGRTTVCGEDDAWIVPATAVSRLGLEGATVPLVTGEDVRDWQVRASVHVVKHALPEASPAVAHFLWPRKPLLSRRRIFGRSLEERGRSWTEHLEHYPRKLETPLSIAFAFVATHNHFALDRGGKLFKQSAPVVKLAPGASVEDHLEVLALLASSTLGFWIRQVSHQKGLAHDAHYCEAWQDHRELDGSKLARAPLVDAKRALPLARALDELGRIASSPLLLEGVDVHRAVRERRRVIAQMRGLQEELDWLVYELFGFVEDARVRAPEDVPPLAAGERPFEVLLARRCLAGDGTSWFSCPEEMRPDLESPRLELLQKSKLLQELEQPEFKRRWHDDLEARARSELRERLVASLEERVARFTAPAAVEATASSEERALAEALGVEIEHVLREESVPLGLARLSSQGLEKHALWTSARELQERADRGERVFVPVPPRFVATDFRGNAWKHRGKLDVPREPFASLDGLVVSTRGGVLARARALVELAQEDDARRASALAALRELLPELRRLHAEPDETGESPAEAYATWLDEALRIGRVDAR